MGTVLFEYQGERGDSLVMTSLPQANLRAQYQKWNSQMLPNSRTAGRGGRG